MREVSPNTEVTFLHCIILQEDLCKSVLGLEHVVRVVVKLINFVRAGGLNHRKLIQLLEDTDAEHCVLLYHSHVRWLSQGRPFKRVWDLREDIGMFLDSAGKADDFPELRDEAGCGTLHLVLTFWAI